MINKKMKRKRYIKRMEARERMRKGTVKYTICYTKPETISHEETVAMIRNHVRQIWLGYKPDTWPGLKIPTFTGRIWFELPLIETKKIGDKIYTFSDSPIQLRHWAVRVKKFTNYKKMEKTTTEKILHPIGRQIPRRETRTRPSTDSETITKKSTLNKTLKLKD